MAKLSETALVMLNGAAGDPKGLVPHQGLKMNAPQQNVVRSLLKQSLLIEVPWKASLGHDAWRKDDDGVFVLKITDDGLRALNIDPREIAGQRLVQEEAAAIAKEIEAKPASLRGAAAAFLAAWDACPSQDATDNPISRTVEALRAALAKPERAERAPRAAGAARHPRPQGRPHRPQASAPAASRRACRSLRRRSR